MSGDCLLFATLTRLHKTPMHFMQEDSDDVFSNYYMV